MKSLLISLFLLAPAVLCATDFTRGSCLQMINKGRGKFAEKHQLANMNALVYNKKLELKILEQLSLTEGCPQPSIISHKGFDNHLNIKNDNSMIDLLSGVGITSMACITTKCSENGEDFVSIISDSSDSPAISGTPGSQCSDGRTVDFDGNLCKVKNNRDGYVRKNLWDAVVKLIIPTKTIYVQTTEYRVVHVKVSAPSIIPSIIIPSTILKLE
ncbi:hypothetical protein CRE_24587 [Caenorhabditis remanei]|uniref:Uncharacterized protein n=1 Tax=Caenorhabditis remanei TaxID=31234 RepID=E3MVB3_CAERE|nr:hypothetical protein CRE_24587 [Caenorhabditis remanei]